MDIVKNQLARIQQQLSGLTPSQKMLTGTLVAIMVMTLLFWGRQAGTSEMEPVLDQAIDKNDMSQIVARLKGVGLQPKVEGDRILVPAEQVYSAVAELAYANLLPKDSEAGFDQMVAKLSPWASASERASLENRGKEITCAQIIGRFPGVQAAQVLIDPTNTRHIGKPNIEPSATVNITMRDAEGVRKVAEAAASVVSGAQASLSPARINVVVNGMPQRLRAAAQGADGLSLGDDQLDLKLKHQQTCESAIYAILSYVPGVRVAVSVTLSAGTVRSDEQIVDKEKSFSKLKSEETEDTSTQDEGAAAEEPGAMPNVGTANRGLEIPSGASAGGAGTQSNTSKSEFDNYIGFKRIQRQNGPGEPTVVSASVRVPRSYAVTVLKDRNPSTTPDDAAVEAFAAKRLKEMEDAVRASAGMKKDALVSVALFDDVVPLLPPTATTTATASIPLLVGSHSKEIALGGLALVSLFMVSMFVRRSAPAPVPPAPKSAGPVGPTKLPSGEALAGEAGEGRSTLDGMELDDEAVRTQQMLDQVSTLVTDDPDAAASLVKRWLNRD